MIFLKAVLNGGERVMASCKDCICYSGCSGILNDFGMRLNPAREVCDRFEDHARFVELPCKVGDDVYCIYHGKIERSGVTSICIGSHYTGIVIYTVQFSFTAENIGKFIFFSVEEAEQALKEREENE